MFINSELEKVTVYSDPSMSRDEYCETILDDLTPSDLRWIYVVETRFPNKQEFKVESFQLF